MTAWWDVWEAECRRHLTEYDLGWAEIFDGRTAAVCWTEDGVARVVIDRPLAEALIAQDAGFVLVPWIRAAAARCRQGGVGVARLPRRWRRARRLWLHAASGSRSPSDGGAHGQLSG